MLIGLAGVTSTGKSTLALAIKEEFGDRVNIQEKISRKEIYNYIGHPLWSQDLHALSDKYRAEFDWGRCRIQMAKELETCDKPFKKITIVDGCSLVKAAYMIFLSGQFVPSECLDDRVTNVLNHCNTWYNALFYLPVTRLPFQDADHRYFKARFLREGQDAVLRRLITSYLDHNIKVCTFDSLDNNLVFDELRKMGV